MQKRTHNKIIYAFIDSQNLNLGVRNQNWQLDFRKFFIYLEDQFNVRQAYLFIGYIPSNRKLYYYLKKVGYYIIFKPTLTYRDGKSTKTKGNVDAELVLYTMININKFDKAIIVSGDGDFHCLIKYLKQKKKLQNLLIPNQKRYSILLKDFSKYTIFVNYLKEKLKRV